MYKTYLLMEQILHQLIGSFSQYLQGFIHVRWCRISSINSIMRHPGISVSSTANINTQHSELRNKVGIVGSGMAVGTVAVGSW